MECILCLDLQEFKSDIQKGDIDCCLEECLNICNKYLTVEVFDFGLTFQKGQNFYCSYQFCFTCFLSVAELVKLHNKLMAHSKTFSESLLPHRNKNEIHDTTKGCGHISSKDNVTQTSTDDSHSVIEEIKSEMEDDDLEALNDNDSFSPLKIDTNSSKTYVTQTKIVRRSVSYRKNLTSFTDTLKPKKIRIKIKKLKLITDLTKNNLYPTLTKTQKYTVRKRKELRMRNRKSSEFLNNNSEREMREAIGKEHKKTENSIENKIIKDFIKEKPSKSKKRNKTVKKPIENNPTKMLEKSAGGDDKVFPCDICGKVIISGKGSFDAHRRLHTGEKPFKCDESDCLMTFRVGQIT